MKEGLNAGAQTRPMISSWRLCVLVFTLAFGARADFSTDFDAANKFYEQGRFGDAAAAYEKLIEGGAASPVLYFNLGNAAFKSGNPGRAIAAYRQAEQLSPRDPELQANLRFVRNQVQGPSLAPTRWERMLSRLTVNEWTVLTMTVLWLWLAVLVAMQLRPKWRSGLRNAAWLGGLGAIAIGICLVSALSHASAPIAVIIARDAVVHNGPLDESPRSFTGHAGAELRVLDEKGDWLQVTVGERRSGWIKREQVWKGG